MSKNPFRPGAVAGACVLACAGIPVHAQGVAAEVTLEPVVVSGASARSGLPAGLPGATASKTAGQLREQNLVNPEDALQYAPNTTIRKRYPGDRNALVAGRSFGTLQPSRALVYLDGYLISNFLGRFDAPRWNMISPESIERVDVLYGPYSALFPGNSIGTTVAVTQHLPKAFELSGRAMGYRQSFSEYGHKDRYDGSQFSLHLGDRLDSGLWYAADLNHQDSTSQPMQYHTVPAKASGAFPDAPTPDPANPVRPVTGIVYDTDPQGRKRAVFGASGGAIDHTVQDTLNLRAGYRFTPVLEARVMSSWWHNDSETRNVSFLRDASGATVWSGPVTDGTNTFDIPAAAFAPSTRRETHQQLGATLKTRHAKGWNASLVVSDYHVLADTNRQSDNPDPVAAGGGNGSVTKRDGTGWNTAELQATYAPTEGDWTAGRHTLAFGAHRNAYKLDNTVSKVVGGNWQADDGKLSQFYGGRSEVFALYAQDAWHLADSWRLTLGWREEWFRTFDGRQIGGGATVNYDARRMRGHSPKAALAFNATDSLLLKLGLGRGVRFPNVEELYNGTVTSSSQMLSDPNLGPETSDAVELSAEQEWERQRLRVSLFHDDVKDAILRQSTTDASVCKITGTVTTGSYSCVQNVDRVKTSGIELAWSAQDLGFKGFSLDTSFAYTFRSEVTANSEDPAMVGKWWLRIPRTRATLLASWRPDDQWLLAAGYRHQGRAYNDTYNLDGNPGVYGGVSKVNQLDLRGAYKASRELEIALGINNATDQRAYQSHPYPGRTLFAELRFNN